MSRELYIHTLSQFRDECERKHMDTETEAFNAAIQALSADGDCISRQAAIDEIDEWIKAFRENGHKESAADARLIQDGIIQLPSAQPYTEAEIQTMQDLEQAQLDKAYELGKQSAQPEPQWIPCKTRLPKENDYRGCMECIDGAVWYLTDKGTIGLGYYYDSTKEWSTTDDLKPYGNVIAWCRIPEPWRGEQE